MTACDPLKSVNIAQSAGTTFDIRLQVIAGAVIALMANVLLFDFCGEELF